MNRSAFTWWLLLSFAVACSRQVDSTALALQYEPPSGMRLLSEEPGPPAVVRFEGGLQLRSVVGAPLRLDASPEEILRAAGMPESGQRPLNATQGTLPAGPVARHEFQQGTTRTLVYVLPREDRCVFVLYTAPERDYGPGLARVERSLSTLKLTR
ncbi:hypothetical protein [Melittangium boletus]|uniref:Lipoprotein n=1 Tax=Melittangium boletus DSM 14713 TaxID=1294270 RepID=A0A250I9R2_9BACT|nr:hypothetical protein [Melittangium boletus]ATB27706.1 hypothetical protein MEBOL_001151 [Melittangium boletus DSM 14713]